MNSTFNYSGVGRRSCTILVYSQVIAFANAGCRMGWQGVRVGGGRALYRPCTKDPDLGVVSSLDTQADSNRGRSLLLSPAA